jgi:hypothetical protein
MGSVDDWERRFDQQAVEIDEASVAVDGTLRLIAGARAWLAWDAAGLLVLIFDLPADRVGLWLVEVSDLAEAGDRDPLGWSHELARMQREAVASLARLGW